MLFVAEPSPSKLHQPFKIRVVDKAIHLHLKQCLMRLIETLCTHPRLFGVSTFACRNRHEKKEDKEMHNRISPRQRRRSGSKRVFATKYELPAQKRRHRGSNNSVQVNARSLSKEHADLLMSN